MTVQRRGRRGAVPQDPNDEPASVLLGRIKMENAGKEKGGGKRKGEAGGARREEEGRE